MLNAIVHSWPGIKGPNGFAGAVDALCKINGPRGLGSATTYNISTGAWSVTDEAIKLVGGSPDSTDVGRIWNEGLAFYGWLFYISKFYEIVDTMIVLAKGKKSSILQTYHHAGAMMAMWAGIRYMSPPIWMFVIVNSAIHTLVVRLPSLPSSKSRNTNDHEQYTYYTFSAFQVRIPGILKRTLTILQIAQIIFGATYAFLHLFIAYDIPVSVPYLFTHNLSTALSSATSSATSAIASATASANVGSYLKKLALRAGGQEGLAENVRNNRGETFGIDAIHAQEAEKAREEVRYRNEYQVVHCIDTSGQAFAIWLNVLYLAPLAYLFVTFFVRSYINRTQKSQSGEKPRPSQLEALDRSARDAIKSLEREIHEAMNEEQGGDEANKDVADAVKKDLQKKVDEIKAGVKEAADKSGGKEALHKAGDKAKEAAEKVKDVAHDVGEKAKKVGKKGKGGGGGASANGKGSEDKEIGADRPIVKDEIKGAEGKGEKGENKSRKNSGDVKTEAVDQQAEAKSGGAEKTGEGDVDVNKAVEDQVKSEEESKAGPDAA